MARRTGVRRPLVRPRSRQLLTKGRSRMSLEDRLESGLPSAWRPDQEDPDLIIGEVVDIQVGTSDYDPYPLIVIKQDDGEEKAIHGFHTVLKNELLRQKPQIGERIGIKYLGEQATKPGSKFKSFIG